MVTLATRIRARSLVNANGCWLWQGDRSTRDGYGRMSANGRLQLVHRLSYTTFVGSVPAGLSVLHRCDVPACCNPEHLFAGTHADNMRDMLAKGRHVSVQSAKMQCPSGHPYDAANTYRSPRGDRRCRECHRSESRRRKLVSR
jgi:hypothetical protein